MGRKAGFTIAPPVPSEYSKAVHHTIVGSAAQMRRLAAGGNLEADIEALNRKITDEDRRLRAVRHAIEYRRIARELWLDE